MNFILAAKILGDNFHIYENDQGGSFLEKFILQAIPVDGVWHSSTGMLTRWCAIW